MRQVVRLSESLPDDFALLRTEAQAEAYGFFDALWQEWQAGAYGSDDARFSLFAVISDSETAAVGAITPDPYDPAPDLLRVRHVYVRPQRRREGVGRLLAGALMEQGFALVPRLSLRAASADSAAFWEALGFRPEAEQTTRSHLLLR